ncbi:secretory pathway protein Sec39-domain-containing protein [Amylocystis lapponica]|nr:secretory pathway protein Sec39-domain-containing protein [Amylocystis lapponica]
MRLGISVARPNLVSLGTCFGKFSKSGKFKLHITALDYLAQFAKYKVWIKPNGEMPFLYGNHVVKAHLGRITEDTPEHQGVVIFSMSDIPLGFGVTARSTVDTRKLDPTAIIVFHQASDLCTQWSNFTDDELTTDKVEHVLKPIYDDLWVAAACADRILQNAATQKSLLDLGIDRTQHALDRSRLAFYDPSPDDAGVADEHNKEDGPQPSVPRLKDQRRRVSLLSHFRDEPADAQLCRLRALLLERLDRLSTFVQICQEAPVREESTHDDLDEEWEDDPWAEEAGVPPDSSASTSPGLPPLPLPTFLSADLVHVACLLASLEHFAALRILMDHHGAYLWSYRFAILDAIPEHGLASQFRDILPAYDPVKDSEQRMNNTPWRLEPDFSESSDVHAALQTRDYVLSATDLVAWYRDRIDLIMSSTGMVDIALSFVQHAASQGLPGLDALGEELSLLARLVYDANPSEPSADDDWTLSKWQSMDPSAVVQAYLAHSKPETIARDISRLVMPYLFVLESRAERAGQPDPSLPNRLLYDYILDAPLDFVAAIFEASKPTLPPVERVLRDDEDMARLALACLYGSDSLHEWPTMSRIFEYAAETTISSLGAFVAPSTTRPRCTPSDLMLFFKPLPSSSLSHALDILDVHLESGEILARNGSIAEQRSWANRMARRAAEDMLKLSGSADSSSRGAFCLLSKDDVVRIFFSGLLSTGRFDVARGLLRSSNMHLSLDPHVIEDICLSCSQEFYENASSGNYHFGDMKLAYDCLDIPPSSDRIVREREFIEATSRLCSFNLTSRSGIPITPIEIRLTKDRLSLVSRVLSSNYDAYKHTQVILDLVHKLGLSGDAVAEVRTLAMLVETALQAEDFSRAYETSERMIDTVVRLRSSVPPGVEDPRSHEASEVCWLACFQLARHPEFEDVQKKLTLMGRALELCPADKLHDVLGAWRRLEHADADERRERLAARRGGAPLRKRADRARAPLAERLHQLRMPDLPSPLVHAPDAAALANKAFSRVAANFPFSVGGKVRSPVLEHRPWSREGSRSRPSSGEIDVSAQASRVLQKGIGWLIGADDDN